MNTQTKTQGNAKASERRRHKTTKLVRQAVVKAGGIRPLAEVLSIDNATVWRWTLGKTQPRSKLVLRALENFLTTKQN